MADPVLVLRPHQHGNLNVPEGLHGHLRSTGFVSPPRGSKTGRPPMANGEAARRRQGAAGRSPTPGGRKRLWGLPACQGVAKIHLCCVPQGLSPDLPAGLLSCDTTWLVQTGPTGRYSTSVNSFRTPRMKSTHSLSPMEFSWVPKT